MHEDALHLHRISRKRLEAAAACGRAVERNDDRMFHVVGFVMRTEEFHLRAVALVQLFVQRVVMMLQRDVQPSAEIVEPVTTECRFRNMLSGGLQRADILPIFGIQVFAQQCFANHRQVKQRIVRNQQASRKILLDLRPVV